MLHRRRQHSLESGGFNLNPICMRFKLNVDSTARVAVHEEVGSLAGGSQSSAFAAAAATRLEHEWCLQRAVAFCCGGGLETGVGAKKGNGALRQKVSLCPSRSVSAGHQKELGQRRLDELGQSPDSGEVSRVHELCMHFHIRALPRRAHQQSAASTSWTVSDPKLVLRRVQFASAFFSKTPATQCDMDALLYRVHGVGSKARDISVEGLDLAQ